MKKYMWLQKVLVILTVVILSCGFHWTCFAAQADAGKKNSRVLFLSSYNYDWDSIPKQLNGFKSQIQGHAKVDYVFMDTKTHVYKDIEKPIYESVSNNINKLGGYDVVVLGDDVALNFALKYKNELFSGVPMVFEGINSEKKARNAAKNPLITGIVESFPMEETIQLAKKLYPKAKQIVAISDDSESGLGSSRQYYDSKKDFPEMKMKELNCSKLTKAQITKKISSYGEDTILIFLMLTHDGEGHLYSQYDATKLVTDAAKIPVFKSDELGIGEGLLGGVVISYDTMGRLAGKMATKILNGTSIETIDVETMPYHVKLDEKVMKKFGLSTKSLPEHTVLVHHTPTIWEKYYKVLIPSGIVIAFLAVILVLIILMNRSRKKYYQKIKERDILLDNLVKNIPGGIAVYKMGQEVETLYYSEGIPAMSGRSIEEYEEWIQGDNLEDIIYKEDIEYVQPIVEAAIKKKETFNVAYRMMHKDGSKVWTQLSAIPIHKESGIPIYYAVFTCMPQEAILYRCIATESPTGVYICDSENYNMLYANNVITDSIGNQAYEDKKCYEYLLNRDCPCNNCKMSVMKKDKFLSREYDINGQHLILKGKLFDWNGITTHIEYVIDNTYRYEEQKKKEAKYETQMKLLSKVSKNCICSFRLNVTKNTIEKAYGPKIIDILGGNKNMDIEKWIEKAKEFFAQEDEWENYRNQFCRSHLLDCFSHGNKTISMEQHMKLSEDTTHWCKSSAIMMQNPTTDDVEGYIYIEDINTGMLRKALTERSMRTNHEMLICIDICHNNHIIFNPFNTSEPMIGKNSEEFIQSYIKKHSKEEDKDEVIKKFSIETVTEELHQGDTYFFFFSLYIWKKKHYYQANYSYIDQKNGLLGLVITDITDIYYEQIKQQQILKEALAQAESANVAKSEFLARMSHDMRTPMNGILGLSYIMEKEEDLKEIKKDLKQLQGSGEYLLRLIMDVLDVNKIDSKMFHLYPKVCDKEKIFASIISIVKPQMDAKAIEFHFEKGESKWKYVMIDEQRLKQIFVNLLSNAIKFTPEGGQIDFGMELISEKNHIIQHKFIIKDTGIGISEEFLPKVYMSFEQENRIRENLGGTGLGLSIVKKLVELMDGSIEIESKINQGTKVTLYLDFPEADTPESPEITKSKDIKILENKRILLCEDHPLNAKITINLLEKQGAVVDWMKNGELGLKAFEDSPLYFYDTILMDIRMPVLGGLEATKAIRSLDRADAEKVPIIAMTANAYEEDVEKAMDVGMNVHLAKPVKPSKMYETIAKCIKDSR
ncbi:MAG: ABC transporter substrate binding protein [Anaerostipes sp.]|nr:ABC transporter substrate binding protein [Anaerostipes sp.]